MCAEGQAHVTNTHDRPNVRDELIGPRCESFLEICGIASRCLLDTGSQVSTVSISFFRDHLKDLVQLKTLDELVRIEVAGGHKLPYHGFVEVQVKFHKSVTGSSECLDVLLLVVDDTQFNATVPILLGTNVLRHCLQLCKQYLLSKHGNDSLK